MKFYLVNKNPQSAPEDGEHEVHREGCSHLPLFGNRNVLGDFVNCHQAVSKAKEKYKKVDGCYYCCPDCHNI